MAFISEGERIKRAVISAVQLQKQVEMALEPLNKEAEDKGEDLPEGKKKYREILAGMAGALNEMKEQLELLEEERKTATESGQNNGE